MVRAGDPLALDDEESQDDYAIGWQGHFRMDGEFIVFEDNDAPDKVTIHGYATSLLLRMIQNPDHIWP